MPRPEPTVFAMRGGGFSMEPDNPALDDYVLSLCAAAQPRICLLPTAPGDRAGPPPQIAELRRVRALHPG